jgi:hypothetical protein
MRQAVLSNSNAFLSASGNGVVKADALNKATITTQAFVSNDNVKKRAGFGAAS